MNPKTPGKRVAILATDGFEEAELTEPKRALQDAGVAVEVIAPHDGTIQGFHHDVKSITVVVDRLISDAQPGDYDALVLPGGTMNADAMRMVPEAQRFIKAIDGAQKPLAVICHAPWELVSANLVRGRTLTSWPSLQDDIRNAGGTWVDREVVVDGNLVTSRKPDDIPAFQREFLALLAKQPTAAHSE
jgi:protease I